VLSVNHQTAAPTAAIAQRPRMIQPGGPHRKAAPAAAHSIVAAAAVANRPVPKQPARVVVGLQDRSYAVSDFSRSQSCLQSIAQAQAVAVR